MSVLMFVDGVIRKERDLSIILDGSALYKSLNENYRVILLTDDKEKTSVWLKTNNLAKNMDDLWEVEDSLLGDSELRAIETIRSKGKIDFVVTNNLDLAKSLIEVGILVMMFLHPQYVRPEFRPDGRSGVKSWQAITEELDIQQGLYDEDKRLAEEADLGEAEEWN
jgi:rRNA-processing protein FCF1